MSTTGACAGVCGGDDGSNCGGGDGGEAALDEDGRAIDGGTGVDAPETAGVLVSVTVADMATWLWLSGCQVVQWMAWPDGTERSYT